MVMISTSCKFVKEGGERCRAAPLHDDDYCFWHSPQAEAEATEARRLGGLRRRREHTVAGAYAVEGLEDVPQLRRLLTIATLDLLGLENSIARGRALIAVVSAGSKLLEVGELEERLLALEAAVEPRKETAFGKGRRRR